MITHESPDPTPVASIAELLASNPRALPRDVLEESAASRAKVARVWESARPAVLFHGHMHTSGMGETADGRRVVSLGPDSREGNIALLDLATLSVEVPSLRTLRGW